MQIIQKPIGPNHNKGRSRAPIGIVIHTEVGSQAGTYAWFNNPAAQASAHYNIGYDGSIWQHVSENDRPWAQGTVDRPTSPLVKSMGSVNPNEYLISIEHEDKGVPTDRVRTDALYEASGWLVADICARYRIPCDTVHIIDHREIRASKTCPGGLDTYRIMDIANRYLNPPPPPPVIVPPIVTPAVNRYNRFATPLTMITNKDTNLWNFNKKGWDFIAVKPMAAGTEFIAVGEAEHSNGSRYYMTGYSFGQADVTGNPSFPNGVNVVDLTLIPPPIVEPTPIPDPDPMPPVPPVEPEPEEPPFEPEPTPEPAPPDPITLEPVQGLVGALVSFFRWVLSWWKSRG